MIASSNSPETVSSSGLDSVRSRSLRLSSQDSRILFNSSAQTVRSSGRESNAAHTISAVFFTYILQNETKMYNLLSLNLLGYCDKMEIG